MARISVFGIGYVGAVAAACLARDGHKVIAVDVDPDKVDRINQGRAPIVEAGLNKVIGAGLDNARLSATLDADHAIAATDVTLVCVGTPSTEEGGLDLSYIKQACHDIGRAIAAKGTNHSVIIRSTVLPGTSEDICLPILERASGRRVGEGLGFGYYPEFLREGSAIEDYDDAGLVVFAARDEATRNFLHMVNAKQNVCLHDVDIKTAEMVKYTSNSWRAAKISFANEIGNISKASGLDGQAVMDILCSDDKVSMSPKFLRPGFAFGGSCLPKDIRALRHLASRSNTQTPVLDALLAANDAQVDRAERMILSAFPEQVAFIGVSFKPGTDDLRESPLAELAARLLARGLKVSIYDPNVAQRLALSADGLRGTQYPQLAGHVVTDLAQVIEAADALVVGNYYQETVEFLGAAAVTKPTIDLTRLRRDLTTQGTYAGICW